MPQYKQRGDIGYVLKFPTGRIEEDETLQSAAHRELREEIGFDAHSIVPLQRMYAEPGHSDAVTELVIATRLYPASEEGDEPEKLKVESWPIRNYNALIQSGRLVDARSIAALSLVGFHLDLRAHG